MNLQFTLARRYLSGRKLRTTLTTLAITFGVLVIFGIGSIMPAFLNAFQVNAMAISGESDATITSKTGEPFSTSIVEKVTLVEGVRAASASLERSISLPADTFDGDPERPDRVAAVTLVGVEPDAARTLFSYPMVDGRFLEAGDTNAAVIAESLAQEANLGLGDTLTLPTTTGTAGLEIVGILPQRLLPGNEEVLVTLPDAQRLFNTPGKVNVIDISFNTVDETRRAGIEQEIETALGPGFSIGVLQAGAELLNNIRIGQMVIYLLGGLALMMGGFIIFNTFRTIVAERRRDIGMLRAVGASRRTITGLILVEGLIQGVLGTALGLLLGYFFGWLILSAIAPMMQQILNIQMGQLPVIPELIAISIAAGVGITLLAGLIPARQASRVTPLEALRPEISAISFRQLAGAAFWSGLLMMALAVLALLTNNALLVGLGSLLFVVGLLLAAPALVNPIANLFGRLVTVAFVRDGAAQLAEGNLSRQPGRTAITASTTMIALAIVVMAAGIVSSISITFKNVISKSLESEFMLVPPSVATWGMNVGASPELAEDLRQIEGVELVSTLRFAGTQVNDMATGLIGVDPQTYQEVAELAFAAGDPETAFRALENGRGMIVNGVMSGQTGVKMGDEVVLLTPSGEATYRVVGVATDFINAKTTTAYISQANIAADFGRTEDVFYQINLREEADSTAVEESIRERIDPYPQFRLVSASEYYQQNAGLIDSMFIGIYSMVLFLAIPSLIATVNTLAIGVIERRREIGMLRAVGATRKQVRNLVLAEALILAAIGTAFGLLTGLYLAYMAVAAINAYGMPVDFIFPATGLLLALASGLLFGAVAAIIPARQASGMEIVAALRYE